jgi:two-component system chemotaxis sensor kinase CheA
MSSLLEQLWPVFIAEATEQLDNLQAELDGQEGAQDIDALFRDFHTLKSSFSMVDLRVLVDLAHACEDVLHGLRRSGSHVTPEIKSLLLETADWLKQQLALASPGHYPLLAHESLLTRLAPFRPPEEGDPENTLTAAPAAATPPPSKADSLLEQEREALAITNLRINSDKLDELVTRVGIMSQQTAALVHQLQQEQDTDNTPSDAIFFEQFAALHHRLSVAESEIHNTLNGIQQAALGLREIPLSTVLNRLPRIVRKRAGDLDKQVQLQIDGGDLLIDKGMIDEITEPLVHILQNAIDHGIETPAARLASGKPALASLHITATEYNDLLRIEVTDDGCGIDWKSIRNKVIQKGLAAGHHENTHPEFWLAYLFSREYHQLDNGTDENTSGLDLVRHRLTSIGGTMDINSEAGVGTRMVMRMPVSVAIQSVMLVETAGQTYALPLRNIQEICNTQGAMFDTLEDQPIVEVRGNPLPLYPLSHLLQLEQHATPLQAQEEILILQHDQHWLAIAVDRLIGRQDLFVRDLHADLRGIPGIGGASLLGNGQVVIILDAEALFALAKKRPRYATAQATEP